MDAWGGVRSLLCFVQLSGSEQIVALGGGNLSLCKRNDLVFPGALGSDSGKQHMDNGGRTATPNAAVMQAPIREWAKMGSVMPESP